MLIFKFRAYEIYFLLFFLTLAIYNSPAIYDSMQEPKKYTKSLFYSWIVVLSVYLLIMTIGYVSYAQYTKIPVTLNIGKSLNGLMDLDNGHLLRSLAALGIIFNLQVSY